ncbi:hypothetical protein LAUMK42_04409 [Mycobacterium persicum]|uniref:Uracil-DNA glycosylase n=1 Tax=Mycobacterium persicum TaxID=1487726 RepID=A0AB38UYB6_9MYCO|nr:hypothetical protein LAUMK42_04409 [Mycobacterium persicum]
MITMMPHPHPQAMSNRRAGWHAYLDVLRAGIARKLHAMRENVP